MSSSNLPLGQCLVWYLASQRLEKNFCKMFTDKNVVYHFLRGKRTSNAWQPVTGLVEIRGESLHQRAGDFRTSSDKKQQKDRPVPVSPVKRGARQCSCSAHTASCARPEQGLAWRLSCSGAGTGGGGRQSSRSEEVCSPPASVFGPFVQAVRRPPLRAEPCGHVRPDSVLLRTPRGPVTEPA